MNSITINNLLDLIKNYGQDDINNIRKAYMFAEVLHYGQYRQSGEPYFTHPLNVAYILASMHADADTICAGLLHDTLEDTKVTREEIIDEFNEDVFLLVEGVTKMKDMNSLSKKENMLANTRKIITGISEDVRIIFIKLADRLHNMRTLEFKNEFKQKEKSIETLEIFVPLAYYVGAYKIKIELEDLALQYLKPDKYKYALEAKRRIELESKECLGSMASNISDKLNSKDIRNDIAIRTKNVYRINEKLSEGCELADIHDLLALKINVESEDDCYRALGVVHREYRPMNDKFRDYIFNPKTNMYRSIHTTVFTPKDALVQTQIRTYEMEDVASYGLATLWNKCGNEAKRVMREELRDKYRFYKSLQELNNMFEDNQEFIDQVKSELFCEMIYVYTTKGRIIILPKNSTPTDVAYELYGSEAYKMVFAIVNDECVEFDHELKNNDRVRIVLDYLSKEEDKQIEMVYTRRKNKLE